MKTLVVKILLFIVLLLFVRCKHTNNCLDKYPFESYYKRSLAINIDSIGSNNNGCIYYVKMFLTLSYNSFSDKAILYLNKEKFYMKLINPESEEFVLFDMRLKEPQTQKIGIKYANKLDSLNCVFEKSFITKDNYEVKVFRIKNFQSLQNISADAIFFVTLDYGIVGSYFTDFDLNGEEIMFSPAGEIFRGYMDYSNIKLKQLL
jgi:hypothetical protein